MDGAQTSSVIPVCPRIFGYESADRRRPRNGLPAGSGQDLIMHLPKAERDAKFSVLDEAAGYFRAAVRSLQVLR
jgi:hypothetical protein